MHVRLRTVMELSLHYLLDRSFVWALTAEDEWDDLLDLGPGVCLMFLLSKNGASSILVDAVDTDGDVASTAKEWVRHPNHSCEKGGQVQVRFAQFPDPNERSRVLALLRHRLMSDWSPVPLPTSGSKSD